VSAAEHDVSPLLGGGLLSDRIRAGHEGYTPPPEPEVRHELPGADVALAPATQIDINGGEVSFLVPFQGQWPNEYWLSAFRQAHALWPSHLVEPLLDDGRGIQLGPLPAAALEEHVLAVQDRVAAANRVYAEQIEPELRRQRDEALRREQEAERLQAEVESKLKLLLG
jgi:hypothetical protein